MTKSDRRQTPADKNVTNGQELDKVKELKKEVKDKEQQLAAKDQALQQQAEELEMKEQEIDRIACVQQSLLPDQLPFIPGFTLAASQKMPRRAGGDYFNFFPLEKNPDGSANNLGKWLVVIANGMGHEPASALITAMLHSILHAFPGSREKPTEVLDFLNGQMCGEDLGGWFATAIVALFDPAQSTIRFASAGHPPPLLRDSADRKVVELEGAQSVPLGVHEEATFKSDTVGLRAGEVFLLYTDGAIEAANEQNELFGMDRFKATLKKEEKSVNRMLEILNEAIEEHRGGNRQEDDMTLVAIQASNDDGQDR